MVLGDHKKDTDLQKNRTFPFLCSYSVLPTKMTYENLFIFVFLESHSGWPNKLYYTA